MEYNVFTCLGDGHFNTSAGGLSYRLNFLLHAKHKKTSLAGSITHLNITLNSNFPQKGHLIILAALPDAAGELPQIDEINILYQCPVTHTGRPLYLDVIAPAAETVAHPFCIFRVVKRSDNFVCFLIDD